MSPALLSLKLALWTTLLLLPVGLWVGRWLANGRGNRRRWVEALVLLPLVLPPTVLGYYLLVALAPESWLGRWLVQSLDLRLAFSFSGLVIASLLVNLPFAIQPVQLAFQSIDGAVREAAWVSGLSTWQTLWRIELPLVWPGLLAAATLTFAHTMGEFGVVLMVGGNIPGETRTLSIAIYDSVQAFDMTRAGRWTLWLLASSLLALLVVQLTTSRRE